jgi:hypothetical protein
VTKNLKKWFDSADGSAGGTALPVKGNLFGQSKPPEGQLQLAANFSSQFFFLDFSSI